MLNALMEVVMSVKKDIVDLTDAERGICQDVVKQLKGTSQKVKRANIRLKSDRGWADAKIAEALECRTSTVERVRRRFMKVGFEETLDGKQRRGGWGQVVKNVRWFEIGRQ